MPEVILLSALSLLMAPGCSREPDPTTQLGELEQAFGVTNSSESQVAADNPQPDLPPEPLPGQAESPQVYVNRAVEAVRAGEPAEGIMLLQSLQQRPGMNAQERMAVQKTIRAVTADLVRRAADGDRNAQAELKRIEAFLSVR